MQNWLICSFLVAFYFLHMSFMHLSPAHYSVTFLSSMFLSLKLFLGRLQTPRCSLSLSDSSLSLAGPASLSGGSPPGLLLLETGPPSQPPTPLPLGLPLPVLVPQMDRGHEEEVHLPTAGAPEAHPGGGGTGVRPSSASFHPPPPRPTKTQYLRNTPPQNQRLEVGPERWRGGR